MSTDDFFDEPPTPESLAKIDIVSTFFAAWLNIIGRSRYRGQLAYMELFAGAGIYGDGTKSTPILVLEHVLNSPHALRFQVVLNEKDAQLADRLEAAVKELPINRLPQPPKLLREEVDSKNAVGFLGHIDDEIPAVLFVDPFGYIGVSRELFIRYIRKGWGRDAVFFFNYTRINAALSDPDKEENMAATFGRDRARNLRDALANKHQRKREELVHAAMEESLREGGVRFIQRFDFEKRNDSLFFISQAEKGLRTMKDVMKTRSRMDSDGVPYFSYTRTPPELQTEQRSLFQKPPMQELRDDLLNRFAGETVSFDELFQSHHPGTRYIAPNYRDALEQLADEGHITIKCPAGRRKGTFGPKVRIIFPKKG